MRDTALRKITALESVVRDVGRAARSAWNPELIDLAEGREAKKKEKIGSAFFSLNNKSKQIYSLRFCSDIKCANLLDCP